MYDTGVLIGVSLAAGLISGITGFGSSLVLMGVLAAMMPVTDATVIAAIVALFVAAVNLWSVRHEVPWRETWACIGAAFPATALGVHLLTTLDAAILRAAVAAMILAGCAVALWQPRGAPIGAHKRWGLVAGLVGGLFGGAVGTSGPPIVLYTLLRGWEKGAAKGVMAAFFVLTGAWRLVLLVAAQVADAEIYRLGLLLLIPTIAAQYLGTCIFRRISTAVFRYAAMALLAATAARLLMQL